MGRVYRARDRTSGGEVALKVLSARKHAERFAREAGALARLEHEAVVRYVDHGVTEDGEPFLVMEWLAGGDLAARLRSGPLLVGEALGLAERIHDALEYVHACGLVHRDLKPSNVVFADDRVDSARIVDFGIAREATAPAVTATGLRVGTPHYMAPEQFFDPSHVDGRADVYALGCVLFECITATRLVLDNDDVAAFARVVLEQAPSLRDRWA
ncbi:MAG: serine/threonine-protein kinase, partial [Polyangiaceae bacterium]